MALKAEIQALYHAADKGADLKTMIEGICNALRNNEDELKDITWSYRLCARDTGYVRAFSLVEGHYADKTEMDEADVIVTGREADLLAILQRKMAPMSAMLRGKITVQGSKAALIKFAAFL